METKEEMEERAGTRESMVNGERRRGQLLCCVQVMCTSWGTWDLSLFRHLNPVQDPCLPFFFGPRYLVYCLLSLLPPLIVFLLEALIHPGVATVQHEDCSITPHPIAFQCHSIQGNEGKSFIHLFIYLSNDSLSKFEENSSVGTLGHNMAPDSLQPHFLPSSLCCEFLGFWLFVEYTKQAPPACFVLSTLILGILPSQNALQAGNYMTVLQFIQVSAQILPSPKSHP